MQTPVTISIVTYNSAEYIADCLRSIKRQSFQHFELIIVDNKSTDSTLEEVKRVYPEARVISLESNKGFGAAHNIAIHASESEYVLVLNPDCTLKENTLRRLLNAAEVHEDAASISPCILRSEKDTTVDSTGLIQTFYGAVYDRGAGKQLKGSEQQSHYIWGVSGACALYRVAALEQVAYKTGQRPEYFDEFFFMYKEDIDLAARLQAKGWKSWYQYDAVAYHDRTATPSTALETITSRKQRKEYINRHSYRNHLLYLVKNSRGLHIIPSFFYELAKLLYITVFETRTLAVLPSVFRDLPEMLNRRYV